MFETTATSNPAPLPVLSTGFEGAAKLDSVTQQVVRRLTGAINAGSYPAGMRLPSERVMADELSVGRKAITAAYGRLEEVGLIRRFRGKGAFVCQPLEPGTAFTWSSKISSQAHVLDEPVLEMLARTSSSGILYPLSAGTPSLDCFPVADFRQSMERLMDTGLIPALEVAPSEGQPRLRDAIAKLMNVERPKVMVTLGAQEGVDLIARCLVEPGEYAVVENPTYPGAIQSLRAAGAKLALWDVDWSLHKLESLLLTHKPKLIFTSPTFHNPTGRVMPLNTRQGLLEMAARYHVPIIEDDVYSRASLDGVTPPPSLLSLDKQNVVAYVSTFSKILAPGLRVGWVVGPTYLIKQLSLMKMRANLFTEGVHQLVLADMLENGAMKRHLERLKQHHQVLRDIAVQELREVREAGLVSFEVPRGSLYLWCKVPDSIDLDAALDWAESQGVNAGPGRAFHVNAHGEKHFRICFTATTPEKLKAGTRLLAKALKRACSYKEPTPPPTK